MTDMLKKVKFAKEASCEFREFVEQVGKESMNKDSVIQKIRTEYPYLISEYGIKCYQVMDIPSMGITVTVSPFKVSFGNFKSIF